MDFKRRFTLLLTLGSAFSLTIMTVQINPLFGAAVGTIGVVVSYWVALILMRRTLLEFQTIDRPD